MLKGLRTKISGYTASLLPVAAIFGYQLDPATITQILSDHGVPLACAQFLTSIGVHHYRNESKVTSEPVEIAIAAKEPTQSSNPLDAEITQLADGGFEDD